MVVGYITVMPAYGRDYKSKAAVWKDWEADKDFLETTSRRAVNRAQALTELKGYTIMARYGKLMKVMELEKIPA